MSKVASGPITFKVSVMMQGCTPDNSSFQIAQPSGQTLLKYLTAYENSAKNISGFRFATGETYGCVPFLQSVAINGKEEHNGKDKYWDIVVINDNLSRSACLTDQVQNGNQVYLKFNNL